MVATRFEDLKIWQEARAFNKQITLATRTREFVRDRCLTDQLRRAALSVMNNIAEGFERWRRAEFLQFLSIAKGSAGESRSCLYSALDAGYLDERTFAALHKQAFDLSTLIGVFRTRLEQSPPKPSTAKRATASRT